MSDLANSYGQLASQARDMEAKLTVASAEVGRLQAVVASLQDILGGKVTPIENVVASYVVKGPRSELLAEARAVQANPMIIDDGLDTPVCDCGELIGQLADEIELLVAALKPFAVRAAELPINERPDDQRWYSIEMRHWREAARIAGDSIQ